MTLPDLKNAKKIRNRGNELKHLLQIQDLTVFEGENELKTNSVLHAETTQLSGKCAQLAQPESQNPSPRPGVLTPAGSTPMRILILNEYFYPDVAATAQQCADLARALAREHHEITVVTGRRGYSTPARILPQDETWEGIRIIRVPSLGLGKIARWQRAIHFASFLAACAWRLLWLRSYDVVVAMTTPPLLSFLAGLFTWVKGGKLCVWVMDLNPDEAVEAGWLERGGLPHRFLEVLLRFSLRRAEKVLALDHFMRERLIAKGVVPGKIVISPPWSDDGPVQYDPEGRMTFRRKHALEGKFVVMYSGNHSPCHPLDTLLEAAETIQRRSSVGAPIVFCFVGAGTELAKVREFVRERNLKNVVTLPYQPLEELAASLSAADLHVVVMGDPFVGIVHPCKIYNILRLGVPFLYIGPPESHVTEVLPPAAVGDWAHLFRHGGAKGVATCIEQCASFGARQVEQETWVAREFSQSVLIPKLVEALKGTVPIKYYFLNGGMIC
jgi:glycosyltransferase involved in cell wall biosynthesis